MKFKFALGDYPIEYKPEIHGPYNPGLYYGKKDTPFTQLKIREIPAWISRRNKTPAAMISCMSRGYWRMQLKWYNTKFIRPTGMFQGLFYMMTLYYIVNYPKYACHKLAKYH